MIHRLRKDRIIQEYNQALRELRKGGLQQPGALGPAHRQSGNVKLRYITDVDAASHEFGQRLQDDTEIATPSSKSAPEGS